jgi:hypothetical protein
MKKKLLVVCEEGNNSFEKPYKILICTQSEIISPNVCMYVCMYVCLVTRTDEQKK